jgi:peroxiredoxin
MPKSQLARRVGLFGLGLLLIVGLSSDRQRVEGTISPELAAIRLLDADGKPLPFQRLQTGNILILTFTGTDCPIANLYMSRLVELARQYRPRGVTIAGINSNSHEGVDQVAAHAKEYALNFPVYKDPDNHLADLLGVERTCEAIVFDGRGRIRYRGAIDDQYTLSAHRDRPTNEYLRRALDELVAGQTVAEPTTRVVGCPIDRVDPAVALGKRPRFRPVAAEIRDTLNTTEQKSTVDVGQVTYAANVASILQSRCQPCHRPGQVGRFSLTTYAQARRWATSIHEVVDARRMPPWHADPRYGEFENDRSLTQKERATLIAWVEQGTPAGDLSRQPPAKAFSDAWTIGEPDIVFDMPEEYTVPASGTIPYQHFRVKTNFKEDRWVQALEARPGSRAVVHHIVVFVDDHKGERNDPLRYMKTHLVSFAPGDLPSVYQPGTAKLIPAGSDLLFEVHYTPVGTAMSDRSSVGLVFAKQPVKRRAFTTAISDRSLVIPPGAPDYEVHSAFTFPRDVHVLSFMPHMHLRGKDFEYKAVYPDGRSQILLSVPGFDFAWQSIYRVARPLAMPRGTRIECVAHFDNSSNNPANPDPTRTVSWGEQTWDEMMIGFLDFAEDLEPTRIAVDPKTGRKVK